MFAIAPLSAMAFSAIRPAQAALQPAMARTPEELSAASVTTGWLEGVATVAGPALAGALDRVERDRRLAGLRLGHRRRLHAARGQRLEAAAGHRPAPSGRQGATAALHRAARRPTPSRGSGPGPPGRLVQQRRRLAERALRNVTTALHHSSTRVMLLLQFVNYLIVGTLDLVAVVLAVSVLHLGQSGAGYLAAARGAGAMLAGGASIVMLSRRRLAGALATSTLAAGAALALLGSFPSVSSAFVLIGLVGLAGAVFKMGGRTLFMRVAPPHALAGVFSLLEAQRAIGLAAGALLVRATVAGGPRAALLAAAAVLLLVVASFWRAIRGMDEHPTIPQVQVQLLRAIPMFASLPPPALEGVARQLVRVPVEAGTEVIRQGDEGDRYYVVADGELDYVRDGVVVGRATRGDGFGELALVRSAPRAATVRARTACLLYALDKDPFVLLVTGFPATRSAADEVVAGYLEPDPA